MDRTAEGLALADARAAHGTPRFAAVTPEHSLGTIDRAIFEKLVVSPDLAPAALEQYRRLAATLHHAQMDREIRVVMVVSAAAGEGKTLTAVNVALTLSESYRRRVLLVDADLRRPSIHGIFNVPNVRGLNEGLRDGSDRPLPLVDVSAHLSLLTAGAPNPDPMGVLSSTRMKRVLQESAARFEWVVLDTPPIAVLPDANLLADMVDAAILVVRAGVTPLRMIQRAIATLGRERTVGVVLNAIEASSDAAHDYGRYDRR
jgi:capsular exopolysaccharide synthesis family protein